MATLKNLPPGLPAPHVTPPWDTAGPPVIMLKLDVNEAKAVRWYLACSKATRQEIGKLDVFAAKLHHTSLKASGARVHDALINLQL
jgi:hypothetical protein